MPDNSHDLDRPHHTEADHSAHRVLAWEDMLCKYVIDDNDRGRMRVVPVSEDTSLAQGDPHDVPILRSDDGEHGAKKLLLWRLWSCSGPVVVLTIAVSERHERGNGG